VTIQNRLPLALSYDSNNTPSGLAEFQISSVDLADVATDHAPEQYQVLTWSAVGDGTFLYAPSTIVTDSADLTAYATTAALAVTNSNLAATGAALAQLTSDFYVATGTALTPTSTFYTTTGTLLEKPSTGSNGDLLLYSTGNNTATTAVDDFITDQDLVKTSDLGTYVTEAEYDASADLFTTTGTFYTTTATLLVTSVAAANEVYFNNAGTADGLATSLKGRAFLNSDTNVGDLGDVKAPSPTVGQVLTYVGGIGYAPKNPSFLTGNGNPAVAEFNAGTSANDFQFTNVVTTPNDTSGIGDVSAGSILFFSGTDASSTKYLVMNSNGSSLIESGSATNVSAHDIDLVSGAITSAPTGSNNIANKSYVDGINNTQHNRLFAVGTRTDSIANTSVYLGWEFDTVSALSVSDSGGVLTIGGSHDTEITFGEAGDYMIDCTVRANADNRIELFCKAEYYDATGDTPAFMAYNRLQNSNYAARDTDQNTGGTTLSLLLSLNQNDKLRFSAEADADGTCVLLVNGTFLRIVKLA